MLKDHFRCLFNEILDGITCPELKELVKTKSFLTGGCFKSLLLKEKVNDYDFYFVDKESAEKFQKIIKEGVRSLIGFSDAKKFRFLFKVQTENAVTFQMGDKQIQFITRFYGLPDEVTGKFDWKHTQNYYIPALDVLKLDSQTIYDKKLLFNTKATHPVNALKRMLKFIGQGWTIEDDQLLRVGESMSKLDFTNPKVVQDQSIGLYLYRESKMRGYNSRNTVG